MVSSSSSSSSSSSKKLSPVHTTSHIVTSPHYTSAYGAGTTAYGAGGYQHAASYGAGYAAAARTSQTMHHQSHSISGGAKVYGGGGGYTTSAYQYGTPTSGTLVHGGSRVTSQHSAAWMQRNQSSATTTYTGREQIISERVVEHEIKVPKKIVREDVVEKVIVVPEKIVHEEVVEDVQKVREKIVEVAKPIIQEKVVEVPEYEYVEKVIEVPERIVQEKVREVPRVEIQERIIEVPKIITQEKVVEVPEIEYREVPYEKIIEVPEIREQVVVKEVPVPQYVDKPVPEYVTVEVPQTFERNIPVPVEAVATYEYRIPQLRPKYKKATFPIYVPRFVEVPVPEELVDGVMGHQAANLAHHVSLLATQAAPSLCEVENIAADIKKMDIATKIASSDYHSAIQQAWMTGKLSIAGGAHHTSRSVTTHQYGGHAAATSGYLVSGYHHAGGAAHQISSPVMTGPPVVMSTMHHKTKSHRKSGLSKVSKTTSRSHLKYAH